MSDSAIMNTYSRLPVVFDHGEGVFLFDEDGNRYLDGIGGIAVNTLGHAHPSVTRAIADQAAKLIHTSNLYQIRAQQLLADRLTALSGMKACFFSNSGAEANEAAIKIARLYGHKRGIKKPGIIVMERAFHGRTMATLSATGNRKIQAGFEPLVSGFVRAPFNDLDALRLIAKNNPDITAILVEPILGEGGVITCDDGYLEGIRKICDDQGWLM
ncbi:MAG: acetylornithine/N-succinyldiaminopimelate aminotransferase, partial [Halieaceae bacterium]